MIFKLNDKNEEVVIDKTGAPGAPYSEFVASLPDNDCRYAVYNVEYSTDDGERAKFVFFLWYELLASLLSRGIFPFITTCRGETLRFIIIIISALKRFVRSSVPRPQSVPSGSSFPLFLALHACFLLNHDVLF